MTLRRKILLIAAVLIAAVLAATTIAWQHFSTSSSGVSASSAVDQFKRAASGSVAGPPRPGVYTYALSGKECAGVAAFELCRNFPSRAQMILTRAPGTITVEIDLSQDHVETSRFTVRPDGRYLAWQRTRIVFGIAQESAATTVPPTLALPATLHVGQHWTQHFSTGGLPVVTTNQVKQKTTMTIGRSTVSTFEIDASSTTGGAHPGTETDRTWHAPDSGLDVRLVVHRRIGGAFPYTMDVDTTLLSLTPLK